MLKNSTRSVIVILVALALLASACSSAPATRAPAQEIVATEEPMQAPATEAVVEPEAATEAAPATEEAATADTEAKTGGFTMCFMPKFVGHPLFSLANEGAQAAAKELGDTVNYVGPTDIDAAQQVEWIENCTKQQVDAIIVGALDPNALTPSMKTAKDKGILTMTWDADVEPDARTLFITPPAADELGAAMAEMLGKSINYEGQWAWLSSGPNVANQVEWIDATTAYMDANPEKFGKMEMVTTVYGESDDTLSYKETEGLIARYPDLKGIISPDAGGLPAGARAIQDSGKCGQVFITGVALPNAMRTFVKDGCVKEFALWNSFDLGYLTIYTTHQVLAGTVKGVAGETIPVGKLGEREILDGGKVVVGSPLIFDADNIDNYDF